MLLKKLDAEDVYSAFIKFYEILQESIEDAIKLIDKWLREAAGRYKESDLGELIRNANGYIKNAFEFILQKTEAYANEMFGKGVWKLKKAQKKAVSEVKNPNVELVNPKHPHDYTMKSNYGEMMVDIDIEKEGKFKRVSNFRVTSLKDKGHHGIDGIYRNLNPPPDFIIVDAKYLGSEKALKETFAPRMSARKNSKIKNSKRQMDSAWIRGNLPDSISDENLLLEIQASLKNGRVDSVAAKIDNKGKVTYYQLDENGNVMYNEDKPKIYKIHKE